MTGLVNSNNILQEEAHNYLYELYENGKALPRLEIYQDINRLIDFNHHITTSSLINSPSDIVFPVKNVPYQASKTNDALNIVYNYLNDKYQVVLALNNKEHIITIEQLLDHQHIP